jgi:hypothetical protein
VVTLSAHDPEGAAVTYSMESVLDSRSQNFFEIDPSTGVVTTKSKLDRESVDKHYFRVTAIDDSFPPRTGTTTLQVKLILIEIYYLTNKITFNRSLFWM